MSGRSTARKVAVPNRFGRCARDFWELALDDSDSSSSSTLCENAGVDIHHEGELESENDASDTSSSLLPSTYLASDIDDPLKNDTFMRYLEDILAQDSGLLETEVAPHRCAKKIEPPGRTITRRTNAPRKSRHHRCSSITKDIVFATATQSPVKSTISTRHRRVQSLDDALLLPLPRMYSALGVCF